MNDQFLKIQNLAIGYSQPVCSGISTAVKKGELVGLAGKNGSGKSTLIRSLLGLQTIISGRIELNQKEISNWDAAKRAREIAVVFSRLDQVPAIPVHELVALGRLPHRTWLSKLEPKEIEIIDNALDMVGINHLRNRFANELSDGQLQMVMIARAMVQDTQLILMDEPTSHLDIENQFRIFELIFKLTQETSKTFIVASHQVELLLQNATQLWWIGEGKFHAGFPEQVAYEQHIFEKLSQEKIKFDYNSGNFRFQKNKTGKINFKSDSSQLAYWVKHALERNGFELSADGAEVRVQEDNINLNGNSYQTISSLLEGLRIFGAKENKL